MQHSTALDFQTEELFYCLRNILVLSLRLLPGKEIQKAFFIIQLRLRGAMCCETPEG